MPQTDNPRCLRAKARAPKRVCGCGFSEGITPAWFTTFSITNISVNITEKPQRLLPLYLTKSGTCRFGKTY